MRKISGTLGFTLVELIVVMAVLGVLLTLGIPFVLRTLNTVKMTSTAFDCNALLRRAKSEAIKKNSPAVVRYDTISDPDPSDELLEGHLMAFVDVHGLDPDADPPDPPDGVFNPVDDGRPFTETDHELFGCYLPDGVYWGGPEEDEEMIFGLTPIGKENVAIMEPDGSIRDIGSFRFGDARGNYLSIEIAPSATARLTLLKWDPDDLDWKEQEEEGEKWTWY